MFRFSIRDLLWLMVVVACATALLITHAQFNAMRKEIGYQRDRLLYSEAVIADLAEGWQKDRPDRIEFDGDSIIVNGDQSRGAWVLRPQ
jgi:hypothetical protein